MRFALTGSVNEAGVYALRGRQEGSRRGRRTTTTTTSSRIVTSILELTSTWDDVAQPAALLAPDEVSWPTNSPFTTNAPSSTSHADSRPSPIASFSYSTSSPKPPLEFVVKPHNKIILPCELEGNYSRLFLPTARYYRNISHSYNKQTINNSYYGKTHTLLHLSTCLSILL